MQKIMCCFLSMFVTIAAAQAQGSFVIKGELTNLKEDAKVILGYFNSGEKPDTVDVKNGVFVIKGTIKEPGKAFVKLLTPLHNDGQTAGTDGQEFFIEKGITQLKGTDRLETAVIKGGQAQADYLLLQDSLKPYNDRMRPLTAQMMKLFKDKDEAAQKALFPQLRPYGYK
ncbi:DUF4369 domain-containing protein [Chitinophaga eiseniae]|uniref:DUF4369 domain-containing protein n=1 Tax=Chitinophaga eiseniae TaxID=634771 RepID=A0A847SK28_9BACT|nr:DUF4369 domain-containing protein [Chitinophaga eiseniae]NLR80133.1 DUF4369 domain-containing protein [Chitinophaga eiseniae]